MPLSTDDILASSRTGRAVVMGIVNVTPDSFSDGGAFLDPAEAVEQARRLVRDGADALDIGAESTRPGSERVPADGQIARLRTILPAVVELGVPVSIDTTRAAVAESALDAGVAIVNDVSAGRDDPDLLPLVAERGAALVLMHMLGEPRTMQADPQYGDVVAEVRDFLCARAGEAETAGVPRDRLVLDPGIGFGKRLEHNLRLLGHVDSLTELGFPVLVGPSRKRFLGELTGREVPAERLGGTLAACLAARAGGAAIFRVHDAGPVTDALKVFDAIGRPRVS